MGFLLGGFGTGDEQDKGGPGLILALEMDSLELTLSITSSRI